MKKLSSVIILILLLVGCQKIENNSKTDTLDNDTNAITINTNNSDIQNDLVYHDYGTGIKLSVNSKLIIKQLDLNLKDETAIISAINLENMEAIKLYDYQPNQDITYTPASDGVYKIIAEITNSEIIDLTPKAIIETSCSEENSGGFITLQ
ncbi:MAG: hypothetical protein ACYDEX_25420 [Mobilitalea sp.]